MTGPPSIDPGPFYPPQGPPGSPVAPGSAVPAGPVAVLGAAVVPGPPAGPGVQAPFVAPPTDGVRRRRWVAIGLAGAALLICCVGGAAGLGSLIVLASKVTVQSEQRAVSDYLSAVSREDYEAAYALICPRERTGMSLRQFQAAQASQPKITSFEVGTPSTNSLVVPATLHYDVGEVRTVRFTLEQDQSTGEFWVCGTEI